MCDNPDKFNLQWLRLGYDLSSGYNKFLHKKQHNFQCSDENIIIFQMMTLNYPFLLIQTVRHKTSMEHMVLTLNSCLNLFIKCWKIIHNFKMLLHHYNDLMKYFEYIENMLNCSYMKIHNNYVKYIYL